MDERVSELNNRRQRDDEIFALEKRNGVQYKRQEERRKRQEKCLERKRATLPTLSRAALFGNNYHDHDDDDEKGDL